MTPKFKTRKTNGNWVLDDNFQQRYTDYRNSLPDGEYELILRPVVKWDVSQMNKYFHAAVIKFFAKGYNSLGKGDVSEVDVRRFLKAKYIGYETEHPIWRAVKMLDHYKKGTVIEPSTADIWTFLKTEKLCALMGVVLPIKSLTTLKTKEQFHGFLKSLNELSIETFGYELPTEDEVM